jgi:pimeloyl-ACP methyl ester carboxylesterase
VRPNFCRAREQLNCVDSLALADSVRGLLISSKSSSQKIPLYIQAIMFAFIRRLTGPHFVSHHVQCASPGGLHHMAYTEWGDPDNPEVVVCVHGLTRNGRDFDALARVLSRRYRVICPDVVGRGRSDWLKDPAGYGFPQYVADMVTLIARLGVDKVKWVGTSMGGLIGMFIGSLEHSPITRLVLNDVGPKISGQSLRRIGEYVGNAPKFPSFDDAVAYMKLINAPFGQLSDAQWRHLTEHSVKHYADGQWAMRYDPGIGTPFRQTMVYGDVDLWPLYDQIRCPVLLTRGAESDLLTQETALEMAHRGPRAKVVEYPAVGHAPMFFEAAQIDPVRDFLHGR